MSKAEVRCQVPTWQRFFLIATATFLASKNVTIVLRRIMLHTVTQQSGAAGAA
jgi:hypothetical protein